jgi:hypothetical protein
MVVVSIIPEASYRLVIIFHGFVKAFYMERAGVDSPPVQPSGGKVKFAGRADDPWPNCERPLAGNNERTGVPWCRQKEDYVCQPLGFHGTPGRKMVAKAALHLIYISDWVSELPVSINFFLSECYV